MVTPSMAVHSSPGTFHSVFLQEVTMGTMAYYSEPHDDARCTGFSGRGSHHSVLILRQWNVRREDPIRSCVSVTLDGSFKMVIAE